MLVALDMARTYARASSFDTESIAEVGFEFPFGLCEAPVSGRYFYAIALPTILAHGFFRPAPELQSLRPGAPSRYLPGREWEAYEPTAEEAELLRRFTRTKDSTLRRGRERRAKFRAALGDRKSHGENKKIRN